jgi:tRNA nucleotidyltransferase (CCA-adding enzyme)
MTTVQILPANELFERVSALPAAGPLLARLPEGASVYLVGGAVRDLLLGGAPFDLDLVVEGDAAAFAASLRGALRVHDRFGTSTVTLNGFSYDIARARRESYPRPGALPDVEPATLREDLLRRDFTVNAIALGLDEAQPGALHAAPGALDDLDARLLRVFHDASFRDDPTRLLRLARYAARLERFSIDSHARELALEAVRDGALGTVSGPRIGAEVRMMAREHDPLAALRCAHELEIDRAIHRGLRPPDEALARRAFDLLPADGRRDLLVLALAARDVPATELPTLLDALAFEAADREAIGGAALRSDRVARALERAQRPSEIAAALAGAGPELVALAGALGPEQQASDWLGRLRHIKLEIGGSDLLAAGVPEGPAVGRGLRAALAAKLDGRIGGRAQELAEALRAAG